MIQSEADFWKPNLTNIRNFIAICRSEIIGLFLNEEIKSGQVSDVINEIKDQDRLVIIAHSYKRLEQR